MKRRKKKGRRGWSGVFVFLGGMLLTAAVMFAFFVFLVWAGVFGALPSREELAAIRQNTASEVYSADGKLLGRYFLENRLTVGNREVSPHVLHALVATEDARFFEHHGIDYVSLGRVLVKTILLGERRQGGGSTLSEQLARNLYPRHGKGWGSLLVSKVKEAIIAARLEKVYDKEAILLLYLNTVPFGEDIYGIETAAKRFFSKHARDLNPAEAATLVGMLAANTAYNPRLHPERSLRRRNVVLRRMGQHGFLSPGEVKRWQSTSLQLHYSRIDPGSGPAPYFLDHLRKAVEAILLENGGDTLDLLTSGLRIETTLDAGLQMAARRAVKEHMIRLQREFDRHWQGHHPGDEDSPFFLMALRTSPRYRSLKGQGLGEKEILKAFRRPVRDAEGDSYTPLDSLWRSIMTLHAAFVALDPRDGRVLAWVGGIDHGRWQYDHVTARRQAGSTFKPFVYATALEEEMKPCDLLPNERVSDPRLGGWSPANADGVYGGYYSLKGALAHSVNTVTASLIARTGVPAVVALARRLGVTSEIPAVPAIALGAVEVSPLEMATAYAPFLNGGRRVAPFMVTRITDRQGRVVYEHLPGTGEKVLEEETALTMLYMLKEVVDSGTARSLREVYHLPFDLAGKTGTTQAHADGWFMGLLPRLVTATWVGAESPEVHFRTLTLGQGSHTALPVFARFVKESSRHAAAKRWIEGTFPPLSPEMTHRFDCADYYAEKPERNLFERLFGRKVRDDSLRKVQKEEREKRREERRKKIRDAMRRLFGGGE